MEIRSEILNHYSLKTVKKIAAWAEVKSSHFATLVEEISKLKEPASTRLAWSLSHIKKSFSQPEEKQIENLASLLTNDNISDGIKRNVLRWFTIHPIPEKLEGILTSKGFEFLGNTKEPVAIRVYAMEILHLISKKYPDLSQELSEILTRDLSRQSAGFRSRAVKILKDMGKRGG